ncbi:MAG: hypothetical protein V1846_01665 [Candidatus Komeilibacteria bacterium]
MSINKPWHLTHRMPKNATIDQRVAWHKEHLKKCGCRKDIPKTLQKYFLNK